MTGVVLAYVGLGLYAVIVTALLVVLWGVCNNLATELEQMDKQRAAAELKHDQDLDRLERLFELQAKSYTERMVSDK